MSTREQTELLYANYITKT